MISVVLAIIVAVLDQLTKVLVQNCLKPIESIEIIPGILRFTYVENRGAAFGMLSDSRAVFMLASVLIIFILSFIIYKYRGQSRLFDTCLGLILGGGVGNMIDRVRLGYVVDFVDFCAFDFWKYVFNLADSAVVIGCFLALIYVWMDSKRAKGEGRELLEEIKAEVNEILEETFDDDDDE